MTNFLDHIKKQQDATGRIVGPVVSPIGAKYRAIRPDLIARQASYSGVQSLLETAQADIEYLAATLQMVLNEVHHGVRGTSADAWLPEPFIVQIKAALGYNTEAPK